MVAFLNIKYHTFESKKKKKLRDKDHHTFFIPNLLLNLTFTSHLSHIQYSHQIKEKRERRIWSRWRSRCTDRRPMEIEVAERTKPVEIGVHHAAQPHPPPHRHSSSSLPLDWIRSAYSFFFFFFFFSYLLVLIQHYCKNWILFCVLCLDYVRRFLRVKQRDWNKEMIGEKKELFLFGCLNFLRKKIHLELLQCSLYLEKHCSNFKEYLEKFWNWRIYWRVNSRVCSTKNRYRLSIGDALSQAITVATLYLCNFSSAISSVSLCLLALHFAIRSRSHAFASIAWTTSLSFLVASTSTASLVNLSHTIGAVAWPRGHVFLSNHLKNLQAWLESCIKICTIYMMVS